MKAYLVHGFCVGLPRGDNLAVDKPLLDLRLLNLEELRHRSLQSFSAAGDTLI